MQVILPGVGGVPSPRDPIGRTAGTAPLVLAAVVLLTAALAVPSLAPLVDRVAPPSPAGTSAVAAAPTPAVTAPLQQLRIEAATSDAHVLTGTVGNQAVALDPDGFALRDLRTGDHLRFGLVAATETAPVGEAAFPDTRTYLLGDDPSAWRSDVVGYAQARYPQAWPGIDVVVRSAGDESLAFDLHVAPGADPSAARFRIEGAERIRVDADGSLVADTAHGSFRQSAPVSYQDGPEGRTPVVSRFEVAGTEVGFVVGDHDSALPLVIDPTIGFSTYFGAGGNDITAAVAVDGSGNIYIAGTQWSWGSPNKTEIKLAPLDNEDVFVAKLNPTGTQVLKTTFIGGALADRAAALAVDGAGRAFIAGRTTSTNLPTAGANAQTTKSGDSDGFLLRLNSAGTALEYGTYLGGTAYDQTEGLALQSGGHVVVSGATKSTDFPVGAGGYQIAHATTSVGCTTPNPGQELLDGYLLRFKTEGVDAGRTYGTYFGGGCYDNLRALAIGPDGAIYAGGYTYSSNAPLVNGVASNPGPDGDTLVVKLPAAPTAGTVPTYASQVGGSSDDIAWGLTVDGAGRPTAVGKTGSGDLHGQACNTGGVDAFAVRLNAAGNAVDDVRCVSGNGFDFASSIVPDGSGGYWMVGNTTSTDLVAVDGIPGQGPPSGGTNTQVFVVRWNAAGTVLTRSYLGGSSLESGNGSPVEIDVALDPSGNVVVAGVTSSADFPTTAGVVDTTLNDAPGTSWDSFVTKLNTAPAPVPPAPASGAAATALSSSSIRVTWTDASANETGFKVQRSPNGTTGWTTITTTGAGVTQHDDTGLAASTPYWYRVVATNGAGDAAPSNVATATTQAGGGGGSRFVAVTPFRLVDSRSGTGFTGSIGTGASKAATVRGVTVPSGGTIPMNATAVVLNVTVTEPSAASYLTAYPDGVAVPNTANLLFAAGQTVPNHVTVPIGTNGKVAFFNQLGTTHVIADVLGWYAPDAGQRFNPISPTRVLDSRTTTGGWSTTIEPGATKTVPITGVGPIPSSATAAVMNVTVTGGTASSFLTVSPSDAAGGPPSTANLLFAAGQTVPNLVTARLGPDGRIAVYNQLGNAHVIIDVVAYFDTTGSAFYPITPVRVVDSRSNLGTPGPLGPVIQLATVGAVAGETGMVANVTATGASLPSVLTVYPGDTSNPGTANLLYAAGQTIPNAVTVGVSATATNTGQIKLLNQQGTVHVIIDKAGYYKP